MLQPFQPLQISHISFLTYEQLLPKLRAESHPAKLFSQVPSSRMHTKSSKMTGPFACSDHTLQKLLHTSPSPPCSHLFSPPLNTHDIKIFGTEGDSLPFLVLICSVTADTDNECYKLCHFDIKDCKSPEQVVAFL